jgi:hypothetical protein
MPRTSPHRPQAAWTLAPFLITLALLFVSGCASPPVEHVRLYADTAAQARSAGNLVLDRIAPIVAAGPAGSSAPAEGAQDCGPDAAGMPRCFDQRLVAGGGTARADPPSVAVHRLALDLVMAYAVLLSDLAEGKSAAEIQAQVGVAADVAGSLLALTGVGAPVAAALPLLKPQLQALAGRLEAARAGQILRQALVADRETIKVLLRALEEETPRIYEIYRTKRQLDLLAAARARDRAAVDAVVEDTRRFHAALEAYVRLLRATAAALDTLARAASEAARPSPQAVQAALRQAIDARAEAQALWNTVRQLDGTRR